jgi:hypothetical protein
MLKVHSFDGVVDDCEGRVDFSQIFPDEAKKNRVLREEQNSLFSGIGFLAKVHVRILTEELNLQSFCSLNCSKRAGMGMSLIEILIAQGRGDQEPSATLGQY